MKKLLIILAILGGIYATQIRNKLPAYVYAETIRNEAKEQEVTRIREILKGKPAEAYAQDFWSTCNRYRLDCRIIPVIARLESSGFVNDDCLRKGGYNGLGWASNRVCFKDYKSAIEAVGKALSTSPYYTRAASLMHKLCVYNIGKRIDCEYGRKAIWLIENY